jgi:hypothetical protein
MDDWEYEELIRCIIDSYEEFFLSSKEKKHSIVRVANEYDNLGKLEDVIVDVTIGKIMIDEQELIMNFVKGISSRLSKVDLQSVIYGLTEEEKNDLIIRIDFVKKEFNKYFD